MHQYSELLPFINSDQPKLNLLKEPLSYHYVQPSSWKRMTVLQICSQLNKMPQLEALGSNDSIKIAIKTDNYSAIQYAAENGNREVIQYLASYLSIEEKKEAVKANYYSAIECAARKGHIEVIKDLETYLSVEEKNAAVRAFDYASIYSAAENGHKEVIQYLESYLSAEEIKAALKSGDYNFIRRAAKNGHRDVIEYFESYLSAEEKKAAVKADNYSAIQYAAKNGHREVIQYLESHLSTAEKKAAVKAVDYHIIQRAAENGHREVIQYLASHLSTAEKKAAVEANNYSAIHGAAENGHREVIEYLASYLSAEEIKAAVKVNDYSAIRYAAQDGYREVIQYLELQLSEEEIKAAVRAKDYLAIHVAAENSHIEIIEYLESHLSVEEIKAAVKARDYSIIRCAAKRGHREVIEYLASHLSAEEKKEAVKADGYSAIRYAAQNGHKEVIEYLASHLSAEEKKEAVKADGYSTIRYAAQDGHREVIQYLDFQLSAEEKKAAVKARDYFAIQRAACRGHREIIQYLESYLSAEEKKAAVKANDYFAIHYAAQNGHTEIIQYLESHLSAEEIKAAVEANDYFAIRRAAENGHIEIVNHFLMMDLGLAYAECHENEYGVKFVHPFIAQMLSNYQQEKDAYEQANPNGVFDLPEQKASLGFYMLRNLIRRGENTSEGMRFLLSIPSIRNLCHQQRTVEGEENELLRLALRIGNTEATALLLQLPEVLRLAEQENFYQNEDIHGFNLRQIARDRESSMIALSEAERDVVEQLKQCYQPESYLKVFDDFKEVLEKRYEANPASIQLAEGLSQRLPLSWEAFQQLKLSGENYQNALMAYHRHEVHTAYRYLSKPNPWMAANASYVYVYFNEQGQATKLRYSTFEEYRLLIALLYLAAFDKDTPAIEGYTLEDRENHFIKALALIGRAHNWDQSRLVVLNDLVQSDSEGWRKTEEYDDLGKGDKPSCYSGVLRRLMQSVLGHGLFKVVSSCIIKQTLNEFIRSYFDKAIGPENAAELEKAYQGLINLEGNLEKHEQCLKSINIPESTKQEMMQQACEQLEKTYKSQFAAPKRKVAFEKIMSAYLNSGKISGIDFISFQTLLSLESLLQEKVKQSQLAHSPKLTKTRLSKDKEQSLPPTFPSFSFFNPEQKRPDNAELNEAPQPFKKST